MIERIAALFQSAGFSWIDAIDVLLVAFIFYELLQFLRGTHALQMAMGAALFVIVYWTSQRLDLQAMTWLMHNVLPLSLIHI